MISTVIHGTSLVPHILSPSPSSRWEESVRLSGVRHAGIRLDARQYKTYPFTNQLLDCLRALRVPHWMTSEIQPSQVRIQKVSGAMTNSIFIISETSFRRPPFLLLRIYGPSSGSLISRPKELHALHVLSSQYGIGPRIYGTFENGRVEEYFDATPLTASDVRDPVISRWIGARMAEFHLVDIERVEGKDWEIGLKKNVKSWLPAAQRVLALPAIPDSVRRQIDLPTFKKDWDKYLRWLSTVDDVRLGSKRVFAHNDTQYGNILRLRTTNAPVGKHSQLIVVDFEYASPNPASYDIANHFHEWTANYHSKTPHLLDFSRYPTYEDRCNFYSSYLAHSRLPADPPLEEVDRERQLAALDRQVSCWGPASHAMWGIWGIVQGRDDAQGSVKEPDFDYIGYAICRLTAFRRAIQDLGI